MIQHLPRLNIRFRQYRMSGRWIELFPDHEKIDDTLLQYNHSQEASDFIRSWERLFYEPFAEVPEVVSMMSDLDLNS